MESRIQNSGARFLEFSCVDKPEEVHDCSFSCIKHSARPTVKSSLSLTIPSHRSFPVTNHSKRLVLHSQVIKLRAEDEHLAKDILEATEVSRERMAVWQLTTQMRDVLATSPKTVIRSPLGTKSATHTVPVWDSEQ